MLFHSIIKKIDDSITHYIEDRKGRLIYEYKRSSAVER